jgi:hypothetical protein
VQRLAALPRALLPGAQRAEVLLGGCGLSGRGNPWLGFSQRTPKGNLAPTLTSGIGWNSPAAWTSVGGSVLSVGGR